ncbi:MAG: septum site-determining protein MinC [Symbiobacteriia bacterium]
MAKRQEDVVFKGQKNGVLAILNDELEYPSLKEKLAEKLALAERFFFDGAEVTLDVGRRLLTTNELLELDDLLRGKHGLNLVNVLHTDPEVREEEAESRGEAQVGRPSGLAAPAPARDTGKPERDTELSADTVLMRRTLRSGQRVRFDGNVVVLGDVNAGAVVIAAGDIVVMGALRGLAHAGSTGNQRAVVAALRLQPTQLRIASFISRSPDDGSNQDQPRAPEVASIKNGIIVIEPYLPHLI